MKENSTSEIDFTQPAIVMYSSNPMIIGPVKKAWGKDFHFVRIKNKAELEKFRQSNKHTDITFIVDIGNSCNYENIEIAKSLQEHFENFKRIATGANEFEPAKLRDYYENACNISKSYTDLPEFITQIKKIKKFEKTSP